MRNGLYTLTPLPLFAFFRLNDKYLSIELSIPRLISVKIANDTEEMIFFSESLGCEIILFMRVAKGFPQCFLKNLKIFNILDER